ncbi:MAG: type II secretion system F family protein [Lachnospiraceae bacterium]|nr:type II secretion system F family protein [Lachnospiraceae bacterium]
MKEKQDVLTLLCRWIYQHGKKWLCNTKVREDLIYLNRKESPKDAQRNYYVGKIKISLLMVLAALFLGMVLSVQSRQEGLLKENQRILRNKEGKGNAYLSLKYRDETGKEGETRLVVEARHYDGEELEELYGSFERTLIRTVMGANKEAVNVTEDLTFPEKIEPYPFVLSWESSIYSIVNTEGEISQKGLTAYMEKEGKDSAIVIVTVTISYDDFTRKRVYGFRIYPRILSETEALKQAVEEGLRSSEESTRTQEVYYLPDRIGEHTLRYEEKKENPALPVTLLLLAVAVGIFFLSDVDLAGKAARRQEVLSGEYADFASRLALYLSCGLTVRGAFFRIAADYGDRKNDPIAEEVQQACHEMESGISETVVYDQFGKRCRGSSYRRLSGLLIQNLKKGSSSLAGMLRLETQEAFEERKRNAKARGEEAGTKMLGPMMLMLLVVMAMILVPAFLSFS